MTMTDDLILDVREPAELDEGGLGGWTSAGLPVES